MVAVAAVLRFHLFGVVVLRGLFTRCSRMVEGELEALLDRLRPDGSESGNQGPAWTAVA